MGPLFILDYPKQEAHYLPAFPAQASFSRSESGGSLVLRSPVGSIDLIPDSLSLSLSLSLSGSKRFTYFLSRNFIRRGLALMFFNSHRIPTRLLLPQHSEIFIARPPRGSTIIVERVWVVGWL